MPDPRLLPVLRAALRRHEIGDRSPYRLSFAGKGRSGASFGRLQGDVANGPAIVRRTLHDALAARGVGEAKIDALLAQLARPASRNPLDAGDARLVDAALAAPTGQRMVDAMDAALLESLGRKLDRCLAAAAADGRRIAPDAQVMIALWINMSGPPTTLLRWLGGNAVTLTRRVPPPGAVVDAAALQDYLGASAHFAAHPHNLAHLCRSAAVDVTTPMG